MGVQPRDGEWPENPSVTTDELARLYDLTPDGVYYHTKRLREKGVLIHDIW